TSSSASTISSSTISSSISSTTLSSTSSTNTVVSTYVVPTPFPSVFANAQDCWNWNAICFQDSQNCYNQINYAYQSVCLQIQQATCYPMQTTCSNGPFASSTSSSSSSSTTSSSVT